MLLWTNKLLAWNRICTYDLCSRSHYIPTPTCSFFHSSFKCSHVQYAVYAMLYSQGISLRKRKEPRNNNDNSKKKEITRYTSLLQFDSLKKKGKQSKGKGSKQASTLCNLPATRQDSFGTTEHACNRLYSNIRRRRIPLHKHLKQPLTDRRSDFAIRERAVAIC